jgi:hypothetical protein
MNAQYNTLSLAVEEVPAKKSRAKVVVAAVALVAFAGIAAIAAATTAPVEVATATDSEYKALDAVPVNCDKPADGADWVTEQLPYQDDLPRWDPAYSTEQDFYNACYYSFRCCTTTGNGNGCYVSDNFGAQCRSCLKKNGPRFVKSKCNDWLTDTTDYEGAGTSVWTQDDLMSDNGVPTCTEGEACAAQAELYSEQFNNYPGAPTDTEADTRSCWKSRGSTDKQVVDYAEKCFEVLSWCNLLCPRDTPQTVDHVMCKHCTLFGFEAGYWDIANFKAGLSSA